VRVTARDAGVVVVPVALVGLALRPVPLAALVALLAGLVVTASVCGWLLRHPPATSATSGAAATDWPMTTPLAAPPVAPDRLPGPPPAYLAELGDPADLDDLRLAETWEVPAFPDPAAGVARRHQRTTPGVEALLRRIEALEARQAWLDGGLVELESFAQAGDLPASPSPARHLPGSSPSGYA
jgi:hypothetical protein